MAKKPTQGVFTLPSQKFGTTEEGQRRSAQTRRNKTTKVTLPKVTFLDKEQEEE